MNTLDLMARIRQSNERCAIHNEPMIYLQGKDIPPICPVCQKEKIQTAEQQKNAEIVEKIERKRTIEVLDNLSIWGDEDLKQCTFANFDVTDNETQVAKQKAMQIAQAYLEGQQFNCLFTGKPGTGKSHLAVSILNCVNSHSQPLRACLFVSLVDLLGEVRESFRDENKGISEHGAIELMKKVDLLVIDDLGTETLFGSSSKEASDFVQRVLFSVLNARKSTIITTNLSGKELTNIYNPKIVSRILKATNKGEHFIQLTQTKDKRRSW